MKFTSSLKLKLIYVFRNNDDAYRGCLKIGEATSDNENIWGLEPNSKALNKAAKKRIDQYPQTAGIAYDLLYTELTIFNDKNGLKSFSDHEVHNVLTRSGVKKKIFDSKNKANEWFITDLETVKKAITAVKEGRDSLHASEVSETQNPIVFRPEQKDAIEKTARQFKKGNEMLWFAKMRFGKAKSTISEHIKHIFEERELDEKVVVRNFRITTPHGAIKGKTQQSTLKLYNLDVIISVGYRVKSLRGTQFRIWATKRLNEYIRKGFTMDDERLKNLGGGGYWKELLQRIRDRASEKVFYRQVLDIYATSIDYDPKAEVSMEFFKKVQNKIHYAVHGQIAAEVIFSRVDAEKEFMGLMTFPGQRPYLKNELHCFILYSKS